MRPTAYRLAGAALVLACSTALAWDGKADPTKPTKTVERILKGTNAERVKEGLSPLKLSAVLGVAAQKHTDDMAKRKSMEHTLGGKGPADRARAAGYEFGRLGENIAMGMASDEVVGAWMKSKGHRANILGKEYTEIGIGVAADEDGAPYYTQLFGTPAGGDGG